MVEGKGRRRNTLKRTCLQNLVDKKRKKNRRTGRKFEDTN
jgi:hypothetical protein